jgi:hypothetical protein
MNCRPNDLAVVVRRCNTGDEYYDTYVRRLIGRIVTVTKSEQQDDQICWTIRNPFWMRYRGERFLVTGIQDRHLQPIRGSQSLDAARRGKQTV